jgi:hypothetical protein
VTGCEFSHVGTTLADIEELYPIFVNRILIPYVGSYFEIGGLTLGIPSLEIILGYRSILDKYVVIESVITVKYGHETENFGAVRDVIRSVTGLTLSVDNRINTASYHYERSAYKVMYHCNALGGDT